MVMDPLLRGLSSSFSGFKFTHESSLSDQNQNLVNRLKLKEAFLDQNSMRIPLVASAPNSIDSNPSNLLVPSSLSVSPEEDSPEDYDFSDIVLKYINQMLMEEDMEEKSCMFQESSALQAAEKSFYEILGEKYPPSPDQPSSLYVDHSASESPNDNFTGNYINFNSNSNTSSGSAVDTNWVNDIGEYKFSKTQSYLNTDYTSQSSFSSPNSVVDELVENPVSAVQVPDLFCESQPLWHFRRGVEEANKFLPNGNNLILNLEKGNGVLPRLPKEETREVVVKVEKKDESEHLVSWSRGRKNLHPLNIDSEEERSNKQSAVYPEQTVRSEMFDMVLLCKGGQGSALSAYRETLQNGASKNLQQNGQSKGSNGGKSRGKKQNSKREVVDLRALLIHCAQAVAADDRRSANELLKQIRQHSSPFGDGSQRLAYCFAVGLEARLAGTGSQIYTTLLTNRSTAADILKAYHLYLAVCPFRKISNFFSNQTIINVSEKATRLHIIDFGVIYGFQWPCLIQRLSARPGGPPKLRITGIGLPQPGFRPAARVEETGRRVANYAESFNVPFEFKAIAQKWETIQIEDLKIDPNEVLVVNCLYRFENLLDETVVVSSPRNVVLNLVRKMNPEVFIHGIVNGAYSAPFFVTRFREALFHFSAQFDMLEMNAPRESEERILIEREIFGRESLNVIACEGSERVERPETYKQWQIRNLRAGFSQLRLNQDIMKKAKDRVKSNYHKDFVIDEDSGWMLQGWKGRITYALSSWRPTYES